MALMNDLIWLRLGGFAFYGLIAKAISYLIVQLRSRGIDDTKLERDVTQWFGFVRLHEFKNNFFLNFLKH
jgi:hypothetical protein